MDLDKTIRRILRETESKRKDVLIKHNESYGLTSTIKLVGVKNYINVMYDGNIKEFFKNEDVEPFYLKEGNDYINMYINDILVEYLDLPDLSLDEKTLGDFRYGPKNDNLGFSIKTRLRKVRRNDFDWWVVAGISGSYGFGYGHLTKKETLGKKYRRQIFNQIIDKYNLKELTK